jgi:hypothetical protein
VVVHFIVLRALGVLDFTKADMRPVILSESEEELFLLIRS